MLLGVTLLAFILVACSNDESASNDNGEKSDNTESSDNNNLEANSGEEEVVELSFWVFGNAGYDVLAEEYMEDHANIKINVNEGEMEDMLDNLLDRSEEHTSELQSRGHLVCRLLLEKK